MGEIADYYVDKIIFGYPGRRPKNSLSATCKYCGMTGLKWRAEANGWRLFENERIEHNRLKEHNCRHQPATVDDFEDYS